MFGPFTPEDEQGLESRVEFEEQDPDGFDEYVADGSKKSGDYLCDLPIPDGLFEREILVNWGRSMLKRFQMNGQSLESEVVTDRLLLTFSP